MVAPTSDKRRISDKGLNRMSHIRPGRPQHAPSLSNPTNDTHNEGVRDRNAIFSDDDEAPQTIQSHNTNAGPVGLSEASASSNHLKQGSMHEISSNHLKQGSMHEISSNHLKQGSMHEISSANSLDVGGQAELPNPGTEKHSTYARVVEEKDKSQSEISSVRKASTNLESVQKTSRTQSNLFSSKLLNSCIIASERRRGLCALVIAFCVLLSHINLPLLGYSIGRSDSSVTSKPLYIILLTDITVVLARLFLDKKGAAVSRESEEEKTGAPQDNKENWDVTVMLLERGLVAYRTIGAVLTDFSIYAVVVICGTSLL